MLSLQSSASEQLEKKTAQLASELYVPIVEPSSLHVSMTDLHRDCGGNSASVRSRAAALETELGDTKVRQAGDPLLPALRDVVVMWLLR